MYAMSFLVRSRSGAVMLANRPEFLVRQFTRPRKLSRS